MTIGIAGPGTSFDTDHQATSAPERPPGGVHTDPDRPRAPWAAPEQSLLVIAEERGQRHDCLTLPFADATVVRDGGGDIDATGPFDAIAVECHSADVDSLDSAVRRALPLLRSGGWVLVPFGPISEAAVPEPRQPGPRTPSACGHDATGAALDRLSWRGPAVFNGRPYAVLQLDGEPAPGTTGTTALLAAVAASLRAVREHTGGGVLIPAGTVANLVARHEEERRRSEHALLGHLDVLAKTLHRERRRRRAKAAPPVLRRIKRVLVTVLRRVAPAPVVGRLRAAYRRLRKL